MSGRRRPFQVDFVGDVVCPWCYLGWTRLKAALATRPDLAVQVAWRPFQLQFDIPDEGLPYAEFMAGLFPDPERRREMDEPSDRSRRGRGPGRSVSTSPPSPCAPTPTPLTG